MKIIGIDPGTGKSSPTGFCIIDPEIKQIYYAFTMAPAPTSKILHHRLVDLTKILSTWLTQVQEEILGEQEKALVCIENFVMRGKGGETLQRLIGAYVSATPMSFELREVHNISMKKLVSGSGDGDKLDVAKGLLRWFKGNNESIKRLQELIDDEEWDVLDSLGLAVGGYMQHVEEQRVEKFQVKRKKRK